MILGPQAERQWLYPLHSILLAFAMASFGWAMIFDITYVNTAEIQWSNFASWLIAGGELFGGLVLAWALATAVLGRRSGAALWRWIYLGVVALMWVLGLFNAFHHSHDGWASVGATGVTLSILCTLLALIAGWILHSGLVSRESAQW